MDVPPPTAPDEPAPVPVPTPAPVDRRVAVERAAAESLSRAFGVWTRNFVPVSLIVLGVNAPSFVFLWLLHHGAIRLPNERLTNLAAMLVPRLFEAVATGVVTWGVIETLRGRTTTTGRSIAHGLRHLATALSVGLLIGLLVAAGTVLLIVPGIVLACGLAVAVPTAVVEGSSLPATIKRSWALTKGAKRSIFSALIAFTTVQYLLGLVTTRLLGPSFAAYLGSLAVALVLRGGWSAVFAPVLYHDLVVAREDANDAEVARVFD